MQVAAAIKRPGVLARLCAGLSSSRLVARTSARAHRGAVTVPVLPNAGTGSPAVQHTAGAGLVQVPQLAALTLAPVPAVHRTDWHRCQDEGQRLAEATSSRARTGAANDAGARASIEAGAREGWTPDLREPAEHAAMLLAWLQGSDGATGELFADDVRDIYREACLWQGWELGHWPRVGAAFADLTGGKSYTLRGGRKLRVYRVPAIAPSCSTGALGRIAA